MSFITPASIVLSITFQSEMLLLSLPKVVCSALPALSDHFFQISYSSVYFSTFSFSAASKAQLLSRPVPLWQRSASYQPYKSESPASTKGITWTPAVYLHLGWTSIFVWLYPNFLFPSQMCTAKCCRHSADRRGCGDCYLGNNTT